MSAIEDEQLLTSTMLTRMENTTLKMPGLLKTNEHHDHRTQTLGMEEEDDAHGGNTTWRTSTVGQAFLKPATTSCKQNERKKNVAEVRPGVRKETKTTSRQQEEEKMVRGHEEEEGQSGREGGREMNRSFLKKLSQGYKGIFASTTGCTSKNVGCT